MSEATIERLLGGTKVIGHSLKTEMDLYETSRIGLPKMAFLHLVSNLNFSMRSMTQLLNVAERTIQRKGDRELLDISTSEQILQIAEVFSRGSDVFESPVNFQNWMNSENMSLGGKKPIDLLPSRYGAQMILDVIGRIEHGIYS